jgi:hypothetical protein
VRLLIGIMREALKLIQERFVGSPLGREYLSLPSKDACAARDADAAAVNANRERVATQRHHQNQPSDRRLLVVHPEHRGGVPDGRRLGLDLPALGGRLSALGLEGDQRTGFSLSLIH